MFSRPVSVRENDCYVTLNVTECGDAGGTAIPGQPVTGGQAPRTQSQACLCEKQFHDQLLELVGWEVP